MTERRRVLVVDDDHALADMLGEYLGRAGYVVTTRGTVAEGFAAARREAFDAVILDVMLPDGDGLDLCRRLRSESDVPVLMLTARGDPPDRIVGLEIGADDYLPKPFNPRELLARLRAILRRRRAPEAWPETLRFGALEIDRTARVVRLAGEERPMTSHQFELLWALAARAGRVLTRDALMQLVRGEDLRGERGERHEHDRRKRPAPPRGGPGASGGMAQGRDRERGPDGRSDGPRFLGAGGAWLEAGCLAEERHAAYLAGGRRRDGPAAGEGRGAGQ